MFYYSEQVYGRFVAVDNNSGRESYLLSRRAEVRVTELVSHSLRVADTSVVRLQGTTLTGLAPGRTEVQVRQPHSFGKRRLMSGKHKL